MKIINLVSCILMLASATIFAEEKTIHSSAKYENITTETKINAGAVVETVVKNSGKSILDLQILDLVNYKLSDKKFSVVLEKDGAYEYSVSFSAVVLQHNTLYHASTFVELYKTKKLLGRKLIKVLETGSNLTDAISEQILRFIVDTVK